MHPTYVVPGLELLRELRWAATDDICQQKNKLLDAYDKEMEYGLSVYMRNVQSLTLIYLLYMGAGFPLETGGDVLESGG